MFDSPQERTQALNALFQNYEGPGFSVRFPDGWQWCSSGNAHDNAQPSCTIVLTNRKALETLLTSPSETALGEAFIRRELDVEGDIFSVFPFVQHLLGRRATLRQRISGTLQHSAFSLRRWMAHGARHSKTRDRAAIAHHYDQPVDFFRPWLGDSMAYSCAWFRNRDDTLDQAQEQKFDLICRKLRLQPGERFLDIGCGWGGLILHAAARYDASALGITLSHRQLEETNRRIHEAGLENRCAVEFRDYRDLDSGSDRFDKIASVGMYEHVGLQNLERYFRCVRSILKPGGVFLNHGIARATTALPRTNSFIDQYVFPDARLVTLPQAVRAAENEGLEIRDVENLREHYEITLRRWVTGLQANAAKLLHIVSEETYRIWLLYTAGCAAAFRRGDIAVYQILFSNPEKGRTNLPLTREDWYANRWDRESIEV